MKNNNNTERIENYLAGALSGAELDAFEQELRTDDMLREDLNIQREVLGGIERAALKEEIQHVFKQIRFYKLLRFGSIGLSILILGILLFFYLVKSEKAVQLSESFEKKTIETPVVSEKITAGMNPAKDFVTTEKTEKQREKKSTTGPILQDSVKDATVKQPSILSEEELKKVVANFLPPVKKFVIRSDRDTILQVNDRGSRLHVKANSFIHTDGNRVKEKVTISFTEYTSQAEIAFSGIPMTYNHHQEEFMFSSEGMFEIKGESGGLAIEIDKPLTMDYVPVQKLDSANFYVLEESKWKELKKLPRTVNEMNYAANTTSDNISDTINKANYLMDATDLHGLRGLIHQFKTRKLRKKYGNNWQLQENNPKLYDSINKLAEGITEKQRNFLAGSISKWPASKKDSAFVEKFLGARWPALLQNRRYVMNAVTKERTDMIYPDICPPSPGSPLKANANNGNRKNTNLNAGSNIIYSGLRLSRFATYNCDQTYRMANRAEIKATFRTSSGEYINQRYFTLIDLKLNAGFTLNANKFECNYKGDNIFLIIHDDGKLFAVTREKFKAANVSGSGKFEFEAEDLSEKVRNAKELQAYLTEQKVK